MTQRLFPFPKKEGPGKSKQRVKDMVFSLKVFLPHLRQIRLERGLFSGGSFEPRTFFLVRRQEAYFYLPFLFYEPTGSLAVLPWSRRDAGFKGIPVPFPPKPATNIRVTLQLSFMSSLNTSLLDALASLSCTVSSVPLSWSLYFVKEELHLADDGAYWHPLQIYWKKWKKKWKRKMQFSINRMKKKYFWTGITI